MDIDSKNPGLFVQILTHKSWKSFPGQKTKIIALVIVILITGLPIFELKIQGDEALPVEFSIQEKFGGKMPFIQNNTLLPIAEIFNPTPEVARKIRVIVTAYSSTPCQTDNTPFITASNSWVRKGIVANNLLPFGTQIKIPELYGDKIFVVEDRMHKRKGNYHVDIWFPSYWEAKNFGAKRAYIEILEG